jgi:hypothetical protein
MGRIAKSEAVVIPQLCGNVILYWPNFVGGRAAKQNGRAV